MRRAFVRLGAVMCLACAACPAPSAPPDAAPSPMASQPTDVAEPIYDGALKPGWQESGSAARDPGAGPATVHFTGSGEWVLARSGLDGPYGAVVFRVKEPVAEGEFLEVHLGSSNGHVFPGVKLKPDHRVDAGDGWTQVRIPMIELDPDGAPLDRIAFRTFRPLVGGSIEFDKIALTQSNSAVAAGAPATPPALAGRLIRSKVSCDAKATKISPLIYGIAHGDDGWSRVSPTARRWGGNPNSRYNWEANFNSSASDWYFENRPSPPYTQFLADNAAHGTLTALTIPMLGWVAKDGTSYSFPVSVFGVQKSTDPWRPDVGNGMTASGENVKPGPQGRTSVEAPPEWAKRWVAAIRSADAKAGKRSVAEYILDNEPMLWSSTHRDLHPDPLGYDELLDRTIRYGTAIREADADATIAGPAEWGWSNYFDSAKDTANKTHTDRAAHQDLPLVEWYLRKLREHEQRSGTRILDVLDMHYYPQEANVYGGGAGGADRSTQMLRLRSTRSLWDPSYVDESWINESIHLLPRMKEWVDKDYPGRGISIGEWNFGGEKDVTGALATAETLGRFGQFGVTSAFYWTAPPQGSSSAAGFLAYRNFDGKGGHFLDSYVPSTVVDGASVFVSRDGEGKHLVIVVVSLTPDAPLAAELDVSSCGAIASQQAYVFSDGAAAFAASPAVPGAGSVIKQGLQPWSITVIDAHLR
jgi:hypothetical protein